MLGGLHEGSGDGRRRPNIKKTYAVLFPLLNGSFGDELFHAASGKKKNVRIVALCGADMFIAGHSTLRANTP